METHVESAKYQKVILFFHFHSLKNILNTGKTHLLTKRSD